MMSKMEFRKQRLKGRSQHTVNPTFAAWSTPEKAFAKIARTLSKPSNRWLICLPLAIAIVAGFSLSASAQDAEALTPEDVQGVLNAIWVTIAAILVIFMNAGFGMLETGFCRQKNAVNILSKNLIVFALATLAYWALGFSFMFGNGNGFIGLSGWFLSGDSAAYGLDPFPAGLPVSVSFLFQVAFAATAATIVSGAVAERVHFVAFLLFSLCLTGIFYPILATGCGVVMVGWVRLVSLTLLVLLLFTQSVDGLLLWVQSFLVPGLVSIAKMANPLPCPVTT